MSRGGEVDGCGEGVVLLIGNVKESGVSRRDGPACSANCCQENAVFYSPWDEELEFELIDRS